MTVLRLIDFLSTQKISMICRTCNPAGNQFSVSGSQVLRLVGCGAAGLTGTPLSGVWAGVEWGEEGRQDAGCPDIRCD